MDEKLEKMLVKTQATGEPTFTIRAQDFYSVFALHAYISAINLGGDVDPEFIREVVGICNNFEAWQAANPDKVKSPD